MTTNEMRDLLAVAMAHATTPMVLSDPNLPDCPLVYVNQAFCEVTGYTAEEVLGRNCRFLQGPNTDARSPARIRAAIAAGEGSIEWIVNYKRGGTVFYNLLFISPVRDAAGAVAFFFANQLDITVGMPTWFVDVSFGPAHLTPRLETEFQELLGEIDVARRTEGLERIVAAAHRLAEIATRLEPGVLERVSLAASVPTA